VDFKAITSALHDSFVSIRDDIIEMKNKLSDLDGKFSYVYSKELRPIQASEVSVWQYYQLSFTVFRVKHFVASITDRNIQFENVLQLSTDRMISLVQDNVAHVDEVIHIQPISREVLQELLKLIIGEVSVDSSSFHHVKVIDDITFHAKNVDNKNYSGNIDEKELWTQ